ncbi:CCA tRNA nucleotidyltransferase [Sphingomonas sp. GlSt437]|uniref:CCA tRNA nucleotidyltransferase n=1 Tax=Sphingomonas sp. GlSt437 TaxID=3389970 RepID=UPI003A89C2E7
MSARRLPDAPWRHREGLATLADALDMAGGATRFVGGAVRDTLLGGAVTDIDLATRLAPDEVIERLKAATIRSVPTGLAHGTVTAVLPSGPVEVTTLRRDVSTDGRHATIAFTDDWREDAMRRDFTINALYADHPSGDIHDYFGGLDDLAAGVVRFIGDPYQRIAEDHLRILRFFRFHARFGTTIDVVGLAACTDRARDLMALSRERIASELTRLLVAKNAVPVVALMVERGIFLPVLPEIDQGGADRLARLAQAEQAAAIEPNAIRRLAALLPADPAIADNVAARLKLSNADRKRLAHAVSAPDETNPRALAYRVGAESAVDQLLLAGRVDDAREIQGWQPPRLPISGGAIVARGIDKGPQVARLLRAVEDQWVAEGFPDAERLTAIVDAAVAAARRDSTS